MRTLKIIDIVEKQKCIVQNKHLNSMQHTYKILIEHYLNVWKTEVNI